VASTILVVEDDAEQAKPFLDLLRFKGYRVVAAENGIDAVALAIQHKPDLVIVDLLLVLRGKELDGYNVIQALRSHAETEKVGILAWTSHFVKEADHIRALRTGADDFIAKDLEFGVLEARIDALLRRVAWSTK
jgi:DNA-binding response OmpR family regulator